MIILLSPSKEMTMPTEKSQRPVILLDKAKELSQASDFLADKAHYQALNLYNGLQYRYLKKNLNSDDLAFLDQRLYIISALYGLVRPLDGIRPYRKDFKSKGLYKAWGDGLYTVLPQQEGPILNLASKEFSKTITPYLNTEDHFITVDFKEATADGELKTHSTISKKGRGQMVNFIARERITDIYAIKNFTDMAYSYRDDLSDDTHWVFVRPKD